MIKFFRKIRQKLLTENRFSKYAIYAVGEIVLVVIGILIALNINNNNERKKQEKKIVEALTEIHKELSYDIEESDGLIEYYQRTDSIINVVLTRDLTYEEYKQNNRELVKIGMNLRSLKIHDNGFKSLMQNSNDLPQKYGSLVIPLKILYEDDKSEIESAHNRVQDHMTPFFLYLDQNTNWSADFFYNYELPDEAIDFFLNNSYYRNYLETYHSMLIRNLYSSIYSFRIRAAQNYRTLTSLLDLEDKVLSDSLLYKINTEDYMHFVGVFKDSTETVNISLKANKFHYQSSNNDTTELIPISNNSFILTDNKRFNKIYFDSIGQVLNYTWQYGRNKGVLKKEK